MSALSLTKSIQTCVIDTAIANKIQSDRFLNPNNMVCPIWDGTNLKGQKVCPDSFFTKRAGCNSALDRVLVENNQRPKYFDYVTLNAAGLNGNMYGNVEAHNQTMARQKLLDNLDENLPNFGSQFGRYRQLTRGEERGCPVGAYENAMAQEAQTMRGAGYMQNGYQAYNNGQYSGMN
jgi:hypothetical protein